MCNLNKDVFIIETNRLILREFNKSDLDELYTLAFQNDYIFNASKKTHLKRYIIYLKEKYNQFKPDDTRFIVGIFLKDTTKLVGWSAVLPNSKLPSTQRERYTVIDKNERNKGYGAESGNAILDYMFKKSNHDEIVAKVSRSNSYYIPITKTLEKYGYTPIVLENLSNNDEFSYFSVTKERYMNIL